MIAPSARMMSPGASYAGQRLRKLRFLMTDNMQDSGLRRRMGEAGRKHVVGLFDYRQVARRFVEIVSGRLGIQ